MATVCFDGSPPPRLSPGEPFGRPLLLEAHLEPAREGAEAALDDAGIRLAGAASGDCVRYAVDLEAAGRTLDARVAKRSGAALAIDPDVWLYRPAPLPTGGRATLTFELPPGHQVSAPWPQKATGGEAFVFDLGPSVFTWRGRVVLGRFSRFEVALPGGLLDVAVLGEVRVGHRGLERWLSEAGRSVVTLYGRLPRQRTQVTVTPTGGAGVHFGLVLRAGGPGVHLLVGERSREEDLVGEWIAVHELSHLALPFVRRTGPWLSEGIATYYQHVLRARAGLLGEEEAWAALVRGFARGRAAAGDQTLAEAGRTMLQSGAYTRVYWAGAAIALVADVELRRRSSGALSLDEALSRLSACCLDDVRAWSAMELCERLDALVGEPVLGEIARAQLDARDLPPLDDLMSRLGVNWGGAGVRLDDKAPLAGIRHAITAPRSPPGTAALAPSSSPGGGALARPHASVSREESGASQQAAGE